MEEKLVCDYCGKEFCTGYSNTIENADDELPVFCSLLCENLWVDLEMRKPHV